MVERWSPKPNVEGSSPSVPALYRKAAIKLIAAFFNGKTGTDVVYTLPYLRIQHNFWKISGKGLLDMIK